MAILKQAKIFLVFFALQLVEVCTEHADHPYRGPPLPSQPFNAVWNVPSERCGAEFGVDLQLSSYNILTNPGQKWNGTHMTAFYYQKMGLYPYFDDNGTAINGGIPQVVNMTAHLAKTAQYITSKISDPDYRGLAVIDWEKWTPLWDRNWGSRKIYKNASRDLVEKRHPDWPTEKIEAAAKVEFETAARTMFTETILLARKLRPGGFWGYYHFPDCYNYQKKVKTRYDCPEKQLEYNDQIQWLFQDSTALYPSIYLGTSFERTALSQPFVYFRIKEAFRMRATLKQQNYIPVYAYTRFMYETTQDFLTKRDLIHTMGQAADMGADGIVIWGNSLDGRTKEACLKLQSYLQTTLGPYILNITTAAANCSEHHCSGHGRCVLATGSYGNRDVTNDNHDVMLTEENYVKYDPIERASFGNTPGKDDFENSEDHVIDVMSAEFYNRVTTDHVVPTCKCYPGWTGETCNQKV